MDRVDPDLLNKAIKHFYALPKKAPFPADSYIIASAMWLAKRTFQTYGKVDNLKRSDMRDEAVAAMLDAVIERKHDKVKRAKVRNWFLFLKTTCKNSFLNYDIIDSGNSAARKRNLLCQYVAENPHDQKARVEFQRRCESTEDLCAQFIDRIRRWSKEKKAEEQAKYDKIVQAENERFDKKVDAARERFRRKMESGS